MTLKIIAVIAVSPAFKGETLRQGGGDVERGVRKGVEFMVNILPA